MFGTNTVKHLQIFFLILKNLELHKAQLKILQNIKKPYILSERDWELNFFLSTGVWGLPVGSSI